MEHWTILIGAGLGTLAVAALFGAWWLWWRLPKRQVDRLRLTIRDPKARADVEDNFRKTIGQLLGGAAVLIGAGLAYLQFSQQQRAAQQQFTQQQQASHDLLISNQVSKGFEQLGSERVVVRLGGIYALEGVMNASEEYHQPVLEALSAFVRDGTRTEKGDGPPATDIQAALTVIGRRATIGTGRPDLANAHIPKAHLFKANLSDANLSDANLSDANLSDANLSGADLNNADLSNANLSDADLSNASLFGIKLINADLSGTNLSRADLRTDQSSASANLFGTKLFYANLSGTDLRGDNLSGANLTGVDLSNANLFGTNLINANLNGTNLTGTDLRGAIVSQAELNIACGTEVKLKPGLTLKPC
jgi:uncharacterized protein YjbI with pentapeptide repeats